MLLGLLLWASYASAQSAGAVSSVPGAAAVNDLAIESGISTPSLVESKPLLPPVVAPGSQGVTPDPAKPGGVKVGSGGHLASVALGLVFIVLLILALGWFMRRFNQGGMFNNSAIKIVAVTPLGTRERLLVVDISGQQLLIGVTATQINTLHVFTEPVVEANNSGGGSEFGRKLLAVLQQKTPQQPPGTSDTRNHDQAVR